MGLKAYPSERRGMRSSQRDVSSLGFLNGTSRWNGAALALFAVIFAAFASWLFLSVGHSGDEQISVRVAQNARAHLLKLQLDEETGLRGFADGRNSRFLEPYLAAKKEFARSAEALSKTLASAGLPSAISLAADEANLNAIWLQKIAAPVIANKASAILAIRGKDYVDRFRAIDAQLMVLLDQRSDAADRGFRRILLPAIALTGLILLVIPGAVLYYGARQASMTHQVETETARADAERRISDKLLEAFQQQQLPSQSNLGFSATYVPAAADEKVGGDWYDAFELPDGRIMFSIGDVAGHGIDAAVSMSRARQAIITASLLEPNPGAVLTSANLAYMMQDTKFATAVCGFIDPRSLDVSYASAGHPQGIIVTPSAGARLLEYGGLPLGIAHDEQYLPHKLAAEEDSLLILYTDGLLEYDRDLLEAERRILKIATEVARDNIDNPASAIRDAVFRNVEPADDVAILTIRFSRYSASGHAAPMGSASNWSVGFRGIRAPFSESDSVARRTRK